MDAFRQIFHVTDVDVKEVRAIYGKTEADIKADIRILREWLKKQPHLPQDDDDDRLEKFLLGNKFRIEKTKSKIESYYSLRGIHRDIYDYFDPTSELIRDFRRSCYLIPSPKLTPGKDRVITWRLRKDAHLFTLHGSVIYNFLALELQQSVDYPVGFQMIIDMENFGFNLLKTCNVNIMHKYFVLTREAFTGRLCGWHYINGPSLMTTFIEMVKLACGPKEQSKIKIHDNLESLQKAIPKYCLIKELGGELDAEKIHEQLGGALIANKDLVIRQANRVTNEMLRVGKIKRNTQFGEEGTFKSLNID